MFDTTHDWGEWTQIKEPTYDEEGEEERVCNHDSSHKETRSILKLDPVIAPMIVEITYSNTDDGGRYWTQGSGVTCGFTFKRSEEDATTFDHFTGIEVDGKAVTEKDNSGKANWTAKSGSVIIDLQPEYLETLSVGKHTLAATFDDGSATVEFTILAKEEKKSTDKKETKPETEAPKQTAKKSADTGDTGNAWIWAIIIQAAVAGIIVAVVLIKKKGSR